MPEIEALDYVYYLEMRRNAYIAKLDATESGREYLMNAWLLSRTQPDREKSRQVLAGR